MHSLRTVRDKFQEMIGRQKAMIEALAAEQRAVMADRKDAESGLADALADFLPGLDQARLDSLSALGSHDFSGMVREMAAEDNANRSEYGRLAAKWDVSSTDAMLEKVSGLERQIAAARADKKTAGQEVQRLTNVLKPIRDHNLLYPQAPLTDETKGAYAHFSLWGTMTDPVWRSARNALEAYQSATGTIASDRAALAAAQTTVETGSNTIPGLDDSLKNMRRASDRMTGLDVTFKGPDVILETVRAAIEQELIGSESFGRAIAQKFGEEAARPLILAALKIRNFDKIEGSLEKQHEQASAALQKLEKPMYKIRRGASNSPSHRINIDLEGIEKSVNSGRAYAGYNLASAASARTAVSAYQPAANDSAFDFNTMLLLYLIMNSNTDPFYTHQTLGIDPQTAHDANLNLGTLTPDFNAALAPENLSGIEGLSQQAADALQNVDPSVLPQFTVPDTGPDMTTDFNAAAPDVPDSISAPEVSVPDVPMPDVAVPDVQVPDVQMPDIQIPDVSMPDFSIPDVSVPDFSMPDISVSVDMPSMDM